MIRRLTQQRSFDLINSDVICTRLRLTSCAADRGDVWLQRTTRRTGARCDGQLLTPPSTPVRQIIGGLGSSRNCRRKLSVLCCSWIVSGASSRGVHGNGKDWDPMGPMGFPWEWEYDQSWEWE